MYHFSSFQLIDLRRELSLTEFPHVCAAFGHDPWTLRFYMTVSPQHPGVTGCAWSHKIIRPTHEVAVSSGLKVKIQVEIKDIIGYKYKQFPPKKKVKSMSCFQILTWYCWLDSNLCSKNQRFKRNLALQILVTSTHWRPWTVRGILAM